jgi:hypothetical protein
VRRFAIVSARPHSVCGACRAACVVSCGVCRVACRMSCAVT